MGRYCRQLSREELGKVTSLSSNYADRVNVRQSESVRIGRLLYRDGTSISLAHVQFDHRAFTIRFAFLDLFSKNFWTEFTSFVCWETVLSS